MWLDEWTMILCFLAIMLTNPVKSDIVRNNERLEKNSYQLQLNSEEDVYEGRKSRINPVGTIKNKHQTQEPISEQVTSVPVTKDHEIISPADDTFEKNLKVYEILDVGKEKKGKFSKHSKKDNLKRLRRQDSTASTTGKSKGTTADEGGSSTVVFGTVPSEGTAGTGESKITGSSGATENQTGVTGSSETTLSHTGVIIGGIQPTTQTGMSEGTKATAMTGMSGETKPSAITGITGAIAKTTKSESTEISTSKPTTSDQLRLRFRAADTIEPGTFGINMEPYTVRDDLSNVRNETIDTIDEGKVPDGIVFDRHAWTVRPNGTNLESPRKQNQQLQQQLNRSTIEQHDKLYQDGSDGFAKREEYNDTSKYALDEESSKFKDPYVVIKDTREPDENSSRIDGQLNERASEEDSSEDRKIPQSGGSGAHKDYPYERRENKYRQSAKEASEEQVPLILYPEMADKIRKEMNGGEEKIRYRQETPPGVPERPRHPSILHASRTSIILSWARPKQYKDMTKFPKPIGYVVEMKDSKGNYNVEGMPDETFLRLNSLEPGNTYYFKVSARGEKGNSPPLVIKYIMDDEIPAAVSGATDAPGEAYIVEKEDGGEVVIKEVLF